MERKLFIKYAATGLLTGSLLTFIGSCKKKDETPEQPTADFTLDLSEASNSALLNSGGSIITDKVVVINNGGTYVALSDICTHQGCNLSFNGNNSKFSCPCHSATFNINGDVLNGPASSSLKKFTVSKSGNILHITG